MDTASGINTPESPASPEGVRSVEETAIPRFECPPNFQQVEISAEDEPLYLQDIKGTTELWLIKTPQDFDVKRLNSKTLSLSGWQFLDETEESDVSYEVLTSHDASSDKKSLPRLLVPSKHCADLVPAPTFSGQLAIMESVAVPPVLLPPSPPPRSSELPPGLKQRFLPFGWGKFIQVFFPTK
ncbi:DNA-directed RNA polymerase I subunit RPA34-like [Patiria miniata]|uniref:Uncharacterized protein n=1 Tax=Patiria miniata TaxID=46514 RepID=A0A913ZRV7_PATMI|nr:DNA-directed RNA polymerase I subunit RPA34-like [Patiria miniata]